MSNPQTPGRRPSPSTPSTAPTELATPYSDQKFDSEGQRNWASVGILEDRYKEEQKNRRAAAAAAAIGPREGDTPSTVVATPSTEAATSPTEAATPSTVDTPGMPPPVAGVKRTISEVNADIDGDEHIDRLVPKSDSSPAHKKGGGYRRRRRSRSRSRSRSSSRRRSKRRRRHYSRRR